MKINKKPAQRPVFQYIVDLKIVKNKTQIAAFQIVSVSTTFDRISL